MNALYELLTTAREQHWCVEPYCTTCGARDYRRAINARPVPLVEALKTARIEDLIRDFRGLYVHDALHLLMMELANRTRQLFLGAGTLDEALEGTEAGEYLAGMRQHAEQLAGERRRRAEYQSPEATSERRRVRAEERQTAHAGRAEKKRRRDAAQAATLEALGRLAPEAALKRIGEGAVRFPLYRLSAEQIERMISALDALTEADLRKLRECVPVTRAQPLARLSKAIEAELNTRQVAKRDG